MFQGINQHYLSFNTLQPRGYHGDMDNPPSPVPSTTNSQAIHCQPDDIEKRATAIEQRVTAAEKQITAARREVIAVQNWFVLSLLRPNTCY